MVVVVFCMSASMIQRRKLTMSTKTMYGMTSLSFLLGTVYWISYLTYVVVFVRSAFHDGIPVNEDWLNNAYSNTFIPVQMTVWSRQLLQIVGDIIVIWRAWVLCGGRSMILPLLLLLGVCATTFAYLGLTISYNAFVNDGNQSGLASDHLFVAFGTLSAATNAATTFIVGIKAWKYRKMWEFVAGRKRSRAEKALLLFVESGCVYCVLQILNVVFVNLLVNYGTAIDYMSLVIREIYTQVTAMYPMAVLVLVNQIASSSDIRSIPTFDESTGMQSEETSPSLA